MVLVEDFIVQAEPFLALLAFVVGALYGGVVSLMVGQYAP